MAPDPEKSVPRLRITLFRMCISLGTPPGAGSWPLPKTMMPWAATPLKRLRSTVISTTACTQAGGAGRGDCMQVTYNRDPDNDGAGPAWSGWAWLDFYNDPATAWTYGPAIQLGFTATQVSFYAWGENGGETINFQAGLAEEGQEQTGDIVLTTTPTQHTIDVSSHAFTEVLSPFLWVTGSAPTYNQQVVFYVDDLVWE